MEEEDKEFDEENADTDNTAGKSLDCLSFENLKFFGTKFMYTWSYFQCKILYMFENSNISQSHNISECCQVLGIYQLHAIFNMLGITVFLCLTSLAVYGVERVYGAILL